MSPATICTDQQMDTPDGRKEARKMAKSRLPCRNLLSGFIMQCVSLLVFFFEHHLDIPRNDIGINPRWKQDLQTTRATFYNHHKNNSFRRAQISLSGLFQEKFQAPPADKSGRPSKDTLGRSQVFFFGVGKQMNRAFVKDHGL